MSLIVVILCRIVLAYENHILFSSFDKPLWFKSSFLQYVLTIGSLKNTYNEFISDSVEFK